MVKKKPHPAVVAKFAALHGLTIDQVKTLVIAGDLVERRGVEWTNEGDKRLPAYQGAQVAFAVLAQECGFDDYEMNGLYPTLRKGGQDIYLPD